MVLKILNDIWPGADLDLSTIGDGMEDPVEIGADYWQKRGLELDDAYQRAESDFLWARGQAFLDKHPTQNRLPWSGKERNRG